MGLIDVSDLLTDPDFASSFTVVRGAQTVGDDGISTTQETQIDAIGSVQSGTGQALILLDDGSRVSDSISVTCKMQLYASMAGRPADIVLWRGGRYVVKIASNWENWGDGFCNAVCEFTGINPA